MDQKFIDIPLTSTNLDRYYIRSSIFRSLSGSLDKFNGKLLDAGCGKMPYRDYILENSKISSYVGLDIETALNYDDQIAPDVTWDGRDMPFEDESFDTVMATEVLEHCTDPEVFLSEVSRVLCSGGYFFFTVPFFWPLHEVPHDTYRYTPFTLDRLLTEAGFKDRQIFSLGGYNASLVTMIGLWVNRHMGASYKKRIIQRLCRPLFRWLLKRDKPDPEFKESSMHTGFYGVIQK